MPTLAGDDDCGVNNGSGRNQIGEGNSEGGVIVKKGGSGAVGLLVEGGRAKTHPKPQLSLGGEKRMGAKE